MSIGIHATFGPACATDAILREVLLAGTDTIRLNLSHLQAHDLPGTVQRIRAVSRDIRKDVEIACDIRGRKLRLGPFKTDQIDLTEGQTFYLYGVVEGQELPGDETGAWVNHPLLSARVREGTEILIDDGAIRLVVTNVEIHRISCRVVGGGPLPARSGLNIPGLPSDLPPIGCKDITDLNALSRLDVGAVYLSYVETAEDVESLREQLRQRHKSIPIIAKIERRVALDHLDAIAASADAICLARGDLGVEIPLCDIPFVQKRVLARTHSAKKPFILAGEVLYSLVTRQIPARAELTDIATALQQGVDGFILSDETAVGIAPAMAVRTLVSLIAGMTPHLREC